MEKKYSREVHLEAGGETHRVLVCLWGLVLAEEKGMDLNQLDTEEVETEGASDDFGQMLDFLWVGMLPFNEDLKRKEVGMMFTPADLNACETAFEKIKSRQITADVQEAIQNGETAPKAPAT